MQIDEFGNQRRVFAAVRLLNSSCIQMQLIFVGFVGVFGVRSAGFVIDDGEGIFGDIDTVDFASERDVRIQRAGDILLGCHDDGLIKRCIRLIIPLEIRRSQMMKLIQLLCCSSSVERFRQTLGALLSSIRGKFVKQLCQCRNGKELNVFVEKFECIVDAVSQNKNKAFFGRCRNFVEILECVFALTLGKQRDL